MTHISFYKIAGDQQVALQLVCQLIHKAQQLGQQVLCLVPDSPTIDALDRQLWAFKPEAFIPHGVGAAHTPVAISHLTEAAHHHDILINLQPGIPTWFSRFERVLEVIHSEPDYQQAKRDSYSFYKERGYPLSFHDLTDKFTP